MTQILHLARTPLNGHPGWLAELQTRNGMKAKVSYVRYRETGRRPYHVDIKWTDWSGIVAWVRNCDILHLHHDMTLNDPKVKELVKFLPPSAIVVQQHYYEQSRVKPNNIRRTKSKQQNEFHCMTAKKGSILQKGYYTLPLVIPHWRKEMYGVIRNREVPRLIFTPTTLDRMLSYQGTSGKGWVEVEPILSRLHKEGVIDVNVITNLNWHETMAQICESDIRLDELVTGGYGQATLDGLATSCITISGISDEVIDLLPNNPPIIRCGVDGLEKTLRYFGGMSFEDRQEYQLNGLNWIKTHYSEKHLFKSYNDFYERCIEKFRGSSELITKKQVSVQITRFSDATVDEIWHKSEIQDMNDKPLRILQIARTNCAGAIWQIHGIINTHTKHQCRTITFSNTTNGRRFPSDILINQRHRVAKAIADADVIHFHNWVDHNDAVFAPYRHLMQGKRLILQYHTEPSFIRRAFRCDPVTRTDITTAVIAQKHARFYPHSVRVPNLFDLDNPNLSKSERVWTAGTPLKVIYSPTDIKSYADYKNTCSGKGYQECLPILKKLDEEGIIELTLISQNNMSWHELMPLKRQHDVCLDEVVTGGYHLCSLEALAQGLITIGFLDKQTQGVIHGMVGEETRLPWVNTSLENFEVNLRALHAKTAEEIQAMKDYSHEWMHTHWHHSKMIQHFISMYMGGKQEITNHCKSFNPNETPMLDVYNVPSKITDELLECYGKYPNSTAVIYGNGPDLLENLESLEELVPKDAIHIGTNAAVYARGNFDFYCIGDARFLDVPEKREIALSAPGIRVYQSNLAPLLPSYLKANYVQAIGRDGFNSDLRQGIYHGYSVVWLAIQVALWCGVKNIVLVGCPHDQGSGNKLRFYDEKVPSPTEPQAFTKITANYSKLLECFQTMEVSLSHHGPTNLPIPTVYPIVS